MDVTSHDIDRVKQQREYRLKHQRRVFEQMVLICRENEVIPISEELLLETRITDRKHHLHIKLIIRKKQPT